MRMWLQIWLPAALAMLFIWLIGAVAYGYGVPSMDGARFMGSVAVFGSAVLLLLFADIVQFSLPRLIGRAPHPHEIASFRAVKAAALGASSLMFFAVGVWVKSRFAFFGALLAFAGTTEMFHQAFAALYEGEDH